MTQDDTNDTEPTSGFDPLSTTGLRGSDRHILQFLDNDGDALIAPPTVIAVNIDYHPGTVRDRMSVLQDAGFVTQHAEKAGYYRPTDQTGRYLRDELADEEIAAIEAALTED